METEIFLKVSFIASITGILILIFLANIAPEITTIAKAKNISLDERIKIQGKIIENRKLSEDFYALTVEDKTAHIQVLINKNFISNQTIEVIGILKQGPNQKQIQAEKIILANGN
jgi:uncharacterized protein YdeI (BOF family)